MSDDELGIVLADDGCAWGPTWRWKFHGWQVTRYKREHRSDGRLWEATAHGRGVSGYRTPFTALLALRRWLKEPARPM